MTPEKLAAAVGCNLAVASRWAPAITEAMRVGSINTPQRQAAFLAQIGHETMGLRFVRELWGPTPAQIGYEGRADLGNTEPGDGMRFLGRGLIQVTGRENYTRMGRALKLDLLDNPKLLEEPKWAALSAVVFWGWIKGNELADKGDFATLTRRINGGLNGFDDRKQRLAAANDALGVA